MSLERRGGERSRYATIQEAIDEAQPGDTVVIPKGVWRESVTVEKRAHPGAPIVIRGIDRDETVVDGASELCKLPQVWERESINSVDLLNLPFAFKGDSFAAWQQSGIRIWTFGNIQALTNSNDGYITKGVFFDKGKGRLYIRGFSQENASTLLTSRNDHALMVRDSSSVIITNLTVRNGGASSLRVASSAQITISNVLIKGGRHGVYVKDGEKQKSSSIVINDCFVFEIYDPEWYWSDFKSRERAPMEGAGIYVVSSGIDNEISGCEISGYFDGIAVAGKEKSGNAGMTIHDNKIHGVMDDAIEMDAVCEGCKIFNNTVYDTFVGFSFTPAQGPIHVYRNIVLSDKKIRFDRSTKREGFGVALKIGGTEANPSQEVMIYNNTLVSKSHVVAAGYKERVVKNFKYVNNIFYSFNGLAVNGSGHPEEGVFFDWNIYYRLLSGSLLACWQASLDTTQISSLKTAKGLSPTQEGSWEEHGIEGDPLLASPFKHPPDVTLLSRSPAIDRGENISELGWPDSANITDGRYDIGAMEKKRRWDD